MEEHVERMAATKYQIKVLDLTKGYMQIPLTPRAQRVAAFVMSFGSYILLLKPFDLLNTSYQFAKFLSQLLCCLEDFCLPCLDDMAIFFDTWENHLKHNDTVLERIQKVKVKLSKCRMPPESVLVVANF